MLDLSVEALGIAVLPYTKYSPLHVDVASAPVRAAARYERRARGIPVEHAMQLTVDDDVDLSDEPDVSTLALAALGSPRDAQPLYLIRDLPRDSMVSALAGLVQGFEWSGEDVGFTHLEELGGTVVFDLLDWVMPEAGATTLICDEPLYADARLGAARFAAVALRVRPGVGPLCVLDCGEGAPGAAAEQARHRFAGSGPCDGWVDLFEALAAGTIADGEQILIEARTPCSEGWALIRAEAVADVRLARAAVPEPVRRP
jgi:hypothetical protein